VAKHKLLQEKPVPVPIYQQISCGLACNGTWASVVAVIYLIYR